MALTDTERLLIDEAALFGQRTAPEQYSDIRATLAQRNRVKFEMTLHAAESNVQSTMTNGTIEATYFGSFYTGGQKMRLVGAYTAGAAVTANHTNNWTLNVTKDNGAGGSQTVIFSANTNNTANSGTGSLTAGQVKDLSSFIVASTAVIESTTPFIQVQVAKAGAANAPAFGPRTLILEFEKV